MSGIVGRFAPSPTGRLHLGNIASMLVAWLAARLEGGRVLLRIEDIDLPRAVKDADRWIMDDLHWLGLDWDGKPVWQSQRLDLYEQKLKELEGLRLFGADGEVSDERAVFPCFCSRKDLREASAPQGSDGFVIYPGTCRHYASDPAMTGSALSDGTISHRHSLRLAMPRPGAPGAVQRFVDALYGPQSWDLPRDIGDVVIRRSDGLFAYQLVVVIDDLLQGVTQIVRGRDLLRSTAVQMWIRRCLLAAGADEACAQPNIPPVVTDADADGLPSRAPTASSPMYLHTPLILGTDGTRLAKRDGALEVATLRQKGVPPEAVIGYLAAVLGLVPSRGESVDGTGSRHDCVGGSLSDPAMTTAAFEPLSAQDLLAMLTPETLVTRLRGMEGKPRDHVVDPTVIEEAAR
jgi:glutamyl/glutaminyl-tRNA synthetase